MDYKALEDFVNVKSVPKEEITSYKKKLPEELLNVWATLGFGTFMSGYIKVVDPRVYQDILEDSYFISRDAIPIMITGFGDIITWEENKYIGLVNYKKGRFSIISSGFKYFFSNISEDYYLNKYFDIPQYEKALEKYGPLEFDECFGYVPLLGLGGPEDVNHLDKVKIIEHIALITQLVGKIE